MHLTIKVDVRPSPDEGRLKIVWGTPDGKFPPYEIDRGMLNRRSNDLRRHLSQLVTGCLKQPPEPYGPILKKIAQAGVDLKDSLFYSDTDPILCNKIKKWLSDLPPGYRITFSVDGYVHIPWGLIYDGDTNILTDNCVDQPLYEDFWTFKFLTCCVYSRVQPISIQGMQSNSDIGILSAIHREIANDAIKFIPSHEVDYINSIFDSAAINISDFFSMWNLMEKQTRILYFYCHANGNTLCLSHSENITTDLLKVKLKFPNDDPSNIVLSILNGCSTAVGNDTRSFIDALSREGFCGFVGTESNVPTVFALRFGAALISEMLNSGKPLLLVMDKLRRQHWPLSILYGIYAYPLLTIQVTDPNNKDIHKNENYSSGTLGVKTL